jgi:hypothetical protein
MTVSHGKKAGERGSLLEAGMGGERLGHEAHGTLLKARGSRG